MDNPSYSGHDPPGTVKRNPTYLEEPSASDMESMSVTMTLSAEDLISQVLTHFILETPKGVLAKSADPDQMPHNVASDLGLHYFASCSTIFQQKYLN